MTLSHKENLEKFTLDLLEMTREGLINWKGYSKSGNKFVFEFWGDNGVRYLLSYGLEFSIKGWTLKLPNLTILFSEGSMAGFEVILHILMYPAVRELSEFLIPNVFLKEDVEFLIPKMFPPDDMGWIDDSKMSIITSGYCRVGERSIKVSNILSEGLSS